MVDVVTVNWPSLLLLGFLTVDLVLFVFKTHNFDTRKCRYRISPAGGALDAQ